MRTERLIRVAVLDADVPVPSVLHSKGLYSDIFADLLLKASKHIENKPTPTFVFEGYDVVKGDYPSHLDDIDSILITGSSASAYDQQSWVSTLNNFIQKVYSQHPYIRLFGSCFGHQIICQALLSQSGAHVTKDPKGWEIGVHSVDITPTFLDYTKRKLNVALPSQMRFQFIHADHVVIPPDTLPTDWMILGSSKHCAVQGVLQPGRVLTYQGHFEFDRFVNSETVKVFGALWDEDVREAALRSIDADDDAELAAQVAAEFLLGGTCGIDGLQQKTGLLTPPDEE